MVTTIWLKRRDDIGEIAINLEDCVRFVILDGPHPDGFNPLDQTTTEEWLDVMADALSNKKILDRKNLLMTLETFRVLSESFTLYHTRTGEWVCWSRETDHEIVADRNSKMIMYDNGIEKGFSLRRIIHDDYDWSDELFAAMQIWEVFKKLPKELEWLQEVVLDLPLYESLCVDESRRDEWYSKHGMRQKGSATPKFTPCQKDCLKVIEKANTRLTTSRVLDALAAEGLIHGESTVKLALSSLVKQSRLLESVTKAIDMRGKGYGLRSRRASAV